jgi:hypothetical protein
MVGSNSSPMVRFSRLAAGSADPPSIDEEDVDSIKATSRVVGRFIPVLVNSNGQIIDGFTRLRGDPNWPRIPLPLNDLQKPRPAGDQHPKPAQIGSYEVS